jgi:hypothetical protein
MYGVRYRQIGSTPDRRYSGDVDREDHLVALVLAIILSRFGEGPPNNQRWDSSLESRSDVAPILPGRAQPTKN